MKGQLPIALIAFVIVILAVAVIVFTNPIVIGAVGALTGLTPLCNADPFNWNCVCGPDHQKTMLPFPGTIGGNLVNEFTCTPTAPIPAYEFPLSQDDPNIGGKITAYAQDAITASCPTCDTVNCPSQAAINAFVVQDANLGTAECRQQTGTNIGLIHWQLSFSLEDGSIFSAIRPFCRSTSGAICNV